MCFPGEREYSGFRKDDPMPHPEHAVDELTGPGCGGRGPTPSL